MRLRSPPRGVHSPASKIVGPGRCIETEGRELRSNHDEKVTVLHAVAHEDGTRYEFPLAVVADSGGHDHDASREVQLTPRKGGGDPLRVIVPMIAFTVLAFIFGLLLRGCFAGGGETPSHVPELFSADVGILQRKFLRDSLKECEQRESRSLSVNSTSSDRSNSTSGETSEFVSLPRRLSTEFLEGSTTAAHCEGELRDSLKLLKAKISDQFEAELQAAKEDGTDDESSTLEELGGNQEEAFKNLAAQKTDAEENSSMLALRLQSAEESSALLKKRLEEETQQRSELQKEKIAAEEKAESLQRRLDFVSQINSQLEQQMGSSDNGSSLQQWLRIADEQNGAMEKKLEKQRTNRRIVEADLKTAQDNATTLAEQLNVVEKAKTAWDHLLNEEMLKRQAAETRAQELEAEMRNSGGTSSIDDGDQSIAQELERLKLREAQELQDLAGARANLSRVEEQLSAANREETTFQDGERKCEDAESQLASVNASYTDLLRDKEASDEALKKVRGHTAKQAETLRKQWYPRFPERPASDKRFAFVMMAYNGEANSDGHLWGVLAMAHMLRKHSDFPLVLLTDSEAFQDGVKVSELKQLDVQVLPLREVPLPNGKDLEYDRWRIAWHKLQIWRLTQYEKLIWLDADALLYRSLDYIFDNSWMKAQRDDWECKLEQESVCSGIMLVFPNETDYDGLLSFANSPGTDFSKGDQGVIEQYFTHTRRPISFLLDLEAAFGQCIGTAPTPYIQPNGIDVAGFWSMPSFVHKSGGWFRDDHTYFNVCFQPNVTQQLYEVAWETINVCHYHPLGQRWRMHLCEAAALIGLSGPTVSAFCSDDCWIRGNTPASLEGSGLKCGPLASKVNDVVYEARTPGQPFVEIQAAALRLLFPPDPSIAATPAPAPPPIP